MLKQFPTPWLLSKATETQLKAAVAVAQVVPKACLSKFGSRQNTYYLSEKKDGL